MSTAPQEIYLHITINPDGTVAVENEQRKEETAPPPEEQDPVEQGITRVKDPSLRARLHDFVARCTEAGLAVQVPNSTRNYVNIFGSGPYRLGSVNLWTGLLKVYNLPNDRAEHYGAVPLADGLKLYMRHPSQVERGVAILVEANGR